MCKFEQIFRWNVYNIEFYNTCSNVVVNCVFKKLVLQLVLIFFNIFYETLAFAFKPFNFRLLSSSFTHWLVFHNLQWKTTSWVFSICWCYLYLYFSLLPSKRRLLFSNRNSYHSVFRRISLISRTVFSNGPLNLSRISFPHIHFSLP